MINNTHSLIIDIKKLALILMYEIYEIVRCATIFITTPEDYIDILPLSWYTCIFSLILPPVICFFALRKRDLSWGIIYTIVKLAQDTGMLKYIFDDLSYTISYGYYSLDCLFSLVSFLVIDVILIVILLITLTKRKDINADNSSC